MRIYNTYVLQLKIILTNSIGFILLIMKWEKLLIILYNKIYKQLNLIQYKTFYFTYFCKKYYIILFFII